MEQGMQCIHNAITGKIDKDVIYLSVLLHSLAEIKESCTLIMQENIFVPDNMISPSMPLHLLVKKIISFCLYYLETLGEFQFIF